MTMEDAQVAVDIARNDLQQAETALEKLAKIPIPPTWEKKQRDAKSANNSAQTSSTTNRVTQQQLEERAEALVEEQAELFRQLQEQNMLQALVLAVVYAREYGIPEPNNNN